MKNSLIKYVGCLLAVISLNTLAAEVSLQKVLTTIGTSRNGPQIMDQYTVVIDNLGFQKQVSVRANLNGTWTDVPLTFKRLGANGKELWSGNITRGKQNDMDFVIKYQVNGKTFWDNNNNANYHVNKDEGIRLFNTNISASDNFSSPTGLIKSTLTLRNIAPSKVVKVVYSTDNWVTTQTAIGTFDVMHPSFEFEQWNFSLNIGTATQVVYAVSYTVNGQTYWDNNLGLNFHAALQ